jgi:hypothetical protein
MTYSEASWGPYAVILALVGVLLALVPFQSQSFGTIDFIQYWSAWRLISTGANPYDPELLHETQAALVANTPALVFSWNPPWTYTLLSPFLAFPFSIAAKLWCLFQVAILLVVAATGSKALRAPPLSTVGAAFAALFFVPSLYSIRYGQLGTLFALALVCFLLCVNSRRYMLAGLSLLPLSVKPHLFILLVIPGVVWITQIPRECATRFIGGALGGFVALVGMTLVLAPDSLSWWITAATQTTTADFGLVHFERWQTHTMATAVRALLDSAQGAAPRWPMVMIPATAFTLTSLYFWLRRPTIEWSHVLPPMICLSIATSSYGWVYDQSALLLCNYLLFARVSRLTEKWIAVGFILAIISVQTLPILLMSGMGLPPYSFFLLPWALLALLSLLSRSAARAGANLEG